VRNGVIFKEHGGTVFKHFDPQEFTMTNVTYQHSLPFVTTLLQPRDSPLGNNYELYSIADN
jgi:hypothetical protein